ncbi:unnamed protein product [Amoebophrya sp. A25]|nr:unnamed protein product [Amoebophrya sp. A25]|eukprot:GSA25T00008381001.1
MGGDEHGNEEENALWSVGNLKRSNSSDEVQKETLLGRPAHLPPLPSNALNLLEDEYEKLMRDCCLAGTMAFFSWLESTETAVVSSMEDPHTPSSSLLAVAGSEWSDDSESSLFPKKEDKNSEKNWDVQEIVPTRKEPQQGCRSPLGAGGKKVKQAEGGLNFVEESEKIMEVLVEDNESFLALGRKLDKIHAQGKWQDTSREKLVLDQTALTDIKRGLRTAGEDNAKSSGSWFCDGWRCLPTALPIATIDGHFYDPSLTSGRTHLCTRAAKNSKPTLTTTPRHPEGHLFSATANDDSCCMVCWSNISKLL